MQVRCPHCGESIGMEIEIQFSDIECPTCGSRFSVVGEEETKDSQDGSKTFGHFELQECVGQGGFGAVWRARDMQLQRTVAIKIPRKAQLTPEEAEKFLREARSLAQLRHPGIVSVHEVGREGATVYIVSDFVDGLTLADRLSTGVPFLPRDAAHLIAKVADALDHAHQAGVFHRDLKPGNIMLDSKGKPYILDFGLARRDSGEVTMTFEGNLLGTPAYLSPEQAIGDAHSADARSDVYSLGVVLFELLTGERPFRGNMRMLIHQVIHDDAPALRRLNASIPKDLETICLKCMEKKPERRFSSAKMLSNELQRWLDNKPIRSRPVTTFERARKWVRRRPAIAALLSVLTLLVILILGILWKGSRDNQNLLAVAQSIIDFQDLNYGNYRRGSQFSAQSANANTIEARVLRAAMEQSSRASQSKTVEAPINSVACSPGGESVAVALNDGRVVLFEGDQETTLIAESQPGTWARAKSLCFVSEDVLLVGGGDDGVAGAVRQITIGDPKSSGSVVTLPFEHNSPVMAVAASKDGEIAASADNDGFLHVWDVNSHTLRDQKSIEFDIPDRQLSRVFRSISLAISPDNEFLAVGGWDKVIQVVRLRTLEPIAKLENENRIWHFAFAPKTDMSGEVHEIVVADQVRTRVLRIDGDQLLETDRQIARSIRSLHFIPSETPLLATGSRDGRVEIWKWPSLKPVRRFIHDGYVASIDYTPMDGGRIVSGTNHGTLKHWDTNQLGKDSIKAHSHWWIPLATSNDQQWIATAGDDQLVLLWNPESGNAPRELFGHEEMVRAVVFSDDSNFIASAGADGNVRVWDTRSGRDRFKWTDKLAGDIWSVAFFPKDSNRLVFGDDRGQLFVWNIGANTTQRIVGHNPDTVVLCIKFSPDGKLLATGGGRWDEFGEILLFETDKLEKPIKRNYADLVYGVDFSPDSTLLATGDRDGNLTVFEAADLSERFKRPGQPWFVSDVLFSLDGASLLTASPSGFVKFWRTTDGVEMGTLEVPEQVRRLRWLDRESLIIAGSTGTVRRFVIGP